MESPGRKSGKPQRATNKLSKKLAPLEDVPSNTLNGSMSSSKSIGHKKDLMEALRRVNPAGVNTAPMIFWDVEGSLKTSVIDDSDVKQQMTIVENGVNYNIKRYNDLKVINDRLTRELKSRLDELDNQKKSYEGLEAMKNAETEEARRITNLQEETERCEQEIADKTHYARKLDHMLTRLKTNQLKFDAHMTGMEETMRNIQKDGADIKLMRRGLDAGLAKAILVLEETKMNLAVARKDREVLLEQRKQEFKNAKVLNEWLKQREKMKIELGIELRGDLTLEEEKFLKSQIDDKMEKTRNLQRASEEGHKKLQSMEEAFTKLKQVTGVKNVEEMHEKFSNQKSNKLQLELEVKDAEHRLNAAKKAHAKQETIYQELKSSGGGLAEINRENIIKLEEAFNEARNEQKFIKADSERISAVLLALHQGGQGLLQRVQPYLSLADGGVFELTQVGEEQAPWTETVESLTTIEHVLTKMMEAIAGDNTNPSPGGGFEDDDDNDSTYSRDSGSIESTEEAPSNVNNIRIKSKKFLRDYDNNNRDEDMMMLMSHNNDKDDDADLMLLVNTTVNNTLNNNTVDGNVTNVGGGMTNETVGGNNMNLLQSSNAAIAADDPNVPSRIAVKKISARKSQEAKRKEGQELRRKRLTERMENKGAAAPGGPDDAGIGISAKYKAQRASADRLCVDKKVPTLPDGVTLRDDPMTKTIAFLNSTPNLN